MMEGYVNYCEYSDRWVLVKPNGERQIINDMVYALAEYFKKFDDDVYGYGEYIKVIFEMV